MGFIYNIVKANCPDCLFPLMRSCYRTIKLPKTLMNKYKMSRIISRAEKLRPYYRDELSNLILSDREKYLLTGNENVFIERAVKQGWRIHPSFSHSHVLIIYDKKSRRLDYTIKFFQVSDYAGKCRIVTLDDFMRDSAINENELIFPIMRPRNLYKFLQFMYDNNLLYTNNIFSRLLESGRPDLQYLDVFDPVDDEIIVDAGCYDGTTAKQFLQWGGGKVKKIYSFEFDPVNAAKCEENLKDLLDKVTLIKKGTWDKDETLYVDTLGTSGSSALRKGNEKVYLTTIDSVVNDERVTFIKMDVEGAELKSLIGAKNTIIKNKPRLAICVYHKPEDIYEIPEYILSLVPEYRFYLRHYSSIRWETVLYASCD